MSQDSRYAEESDLILEEKEALDSLCNELEQTYQEFVSEMEGLWESSKNSMEQALQELVESSFSHLSELQSSREKNQQLEKQFYAVQEFIDKVQSLNN